MEEIEDDVNLDSFGSGSGQLGALRADNISLDGILDEIYTTEPEKGEGGEETTEGGEGTAATESPGDSRVYAAPSPIEENEKAGAVTYNPATSSEKSNQPREKRSWLEWLLGWKRRK